MAETFTNASLKLNSTSATDLYQAPTGNAADRSVVLSCLVANVNVASGAQITVALTDDTNTVLSTLASSVVVPPQASLEIITNKLVLKQSQKLRATASSADDLELTLSALEITA